MTKLNFPEESIDHMYFGRFIDMYDCYLEMIRPAKESKEEKVEPLSKLMEL